MSASVVDICNLALSHLGDKANVSDLEEMSAQSDQCKRYYPIAKNLCLVQHAWDFATRRINPAEVATPPAVTKWAFCYQAPSDMMKAIEVLPEGGNEQSGVPFIIESDTTGARVIYCDFPNITLRYIALVDDPTKFSAMFTVTLSWLLASYLAGPIVKGDAGVAAGRACNDVYLGNLAAAKASDANQQQIPQSYVPQGIRARGGVVPPFGRAIP